MYTARVHSTAALWQLFYNIFKRISLCVTLFHRKNRMAPTKNHTHQLLFPSIPVLEQYQFSSDSQDNLFIFIKMNLRSIWVYQINCIFYITFQTVHHHQFYINLSCYILRSLHWRLVMKHIKGINFDVTSLIVPHKKL